MAVGPIKGLHKATARVADGSRRTYWYAWKGGPRLEGEPGTPVFEASYLVMGLGDVYLGTPVATPLDPRHRLVTTKYNPARTWTPENAVGIGGAYLCIYGMEGPGGYQFVGRTTQVWRRHAGTPWLLRYFDRIRWYPVSAEELLDLRADEPEFRIDDGEFKLADYRTFLADNAVSIDAFQARQAAAFADERDSWRQSGEL